MLLFALDVAIYEPDPAPDVLGTKPASLAWPVELDVGALGFCPAKRLSEGLVCDPRWAVFLRLKSRMILAT